jgi:DNA-binding MarR family transcriptional regulator
MILAGIHVVSNRIGRAFYGEVEAKHGISLVEWRALVTLAHRGSATASEIVAAWGLEKMSANRAVARLRRRGLVRRAAPTDVADRRRQPLALTALGRRLYLRIAPAATRRYRAILAPLTKAEQRALSTALAKLVDRMEALDRSAPPRGRAPSGRLALRRRKR